MRRSHTPDAIADIIRNQNCPSRIHDDTDRPTKSVSFVVQEAREEVLWLTLGFAVFEADEHDFVSTRLLSVPGTV